MVQAATEVPEAEAQGKVKSIYEDIKSTLRTPIVGITFRQLATVPDYLEVAWPSLKPNVQTAFFEQQADLIRARAVEDMAGLGRPPASPEPAQPEAGQGLDSLHYDLSKTLLALAALRAATLGQQPKLVELSRDQKRQIAAGVPDGAVGIEVGGRWPDSLRDAWASLDPIETAPEFKKLQHALTKLAEETIVALPYRMDINPHVLRQTGLSERQLDDVRSILEIGYRSLPGQIARTAYLEIGLKGRDAAAQSPFPVNAL